MSEPIKFEVKNKGKDLLPPKKRGKKSMWSNRTEAPRLLALRKAAKDQMKDQGVEKPYCRETKIRLTLCVYVQSERERESGETGAGDLDNFITGVCDGLMAAHDNLLRAETWHEDFDTAEEELHPSEAIAYEDDSQIMEICAKKVVDPTPGDDGWYEVKLEELPS
ncbi:MAG: RusA family crossover junction endodeoxyribonuclease [Rhodospirillaceae bacterium]|nr:RusA family crossover junction endodeoxyribonuclease [Rhodospirillaceae bacterium]